MGQKPIRHSVFINSVAGNRVIFGHPGNSQILVTECRWPSVALARKHQWCNRVFSRKLMAHSNQILGSNQI